MPPASIRRQLLARFSSLGRQAPPSITTTSANTRQTTSTLAPVIDWLGLPQALALPTGVSSTANFPSPCTACATVASNALDSLQSSPQPAAALQPFCDSTQGPHGHTLDQPSCPDEGGSKRGMGMNILN